MEQIAQLLTSIPGSLLSSIVYLTVCCLATILYDSVPYVRLYVTRQQTRPIYETKGLWIMHESWIQFLPRVQTDEVLLWNAGQVWLGTTSFQLFKVCAV